MSFIIRLNKNTDNGVGHNFLFTINKIFVIVYNREVFSLLSNSNFNAKIINSTPTI